MIPRCICCICISLCRVHLASNSRVLRHIGTAAKLSHAEHAPVTYYCCVLTSQAPALKDVLKADIKIAGIANSKRMIVNPDGLNLSNWKDDLAQAGHFEPYADVLLVVMASLGPHLLVVVVRAVSHQPLQQHSRHGDGEIMAF